ncbi:citrate lyase subunit alpha [Escherichia coli]
MNSGNANGYTGKACCGSLGYAMVDADNATTGCDAYRSNCCLIRIIRQGIEQDQVDLIVKVDRVGDAAKLALALPV